jgi:hypothetical protein
VKGHKGIVDCRGQIAEVRSRSGEDAGGFLCSLPNLLCKIL